MEQQNFKTEQEKKVKNYYLSIDQSNLDEALSIFTDTIVYRRGESLEIRGIEKLKNFYRNSRIIKNGVHKNLQFSYQDQTVTVIGNFVGELKDGQKVDVKFKDVFFFDDTGKAIKRVTSFPNGKEI